MAEIINEKDSKLHISLKLIFRSSLIVLLGLFLSRLFSYIYRIIIARYYGPEVYGIFSLALMIFSLFVVISSLGLNDGILRYVSLYRGKNESNKINYIVRFCLTVISISAIIFTILLFLSADLISIKIFHNLSLALYLKLFSVLILINAVGNIFLILLRAFEKVNLYSFINNILSNTLRILFITLFIFMGFKSSAILSSYLISILGVSLASYLFCKYKLPEIFIKSKLKKADKRAISREIILYSWPLIFMSVFSSIFSWADSFLIGYFSSAVQVGFYNAAVPIAALFVITSEIFMQLFFPMITKEYSRKKYDLIKELSKQIEKWIFMINLPFLLLILIFPGVFINILFGSTYLVAENALRILSIGFFFMSLSSVSISLLSMLGKSKTVLINMTVCSIINIVLNILLIPRYGIIGAALATALSYILLGSAYILQVGHIINIFPFRRKMIRIVFVSIIPLASLLLINNYFPSNLLVILLSGLLFILLYILLLFLTNCLDRNDRVVINAFLGKIFNKTAI